MPWSPVLAFLGVAMDYRGIAQERQRSYFEPIGVLANGRYSAKIALSVLLWPFELYWHCNVDCRRATLGCRVSALSVSIDRKDGCADASRCWARWGQRRLGVARRHCQEQPPFLPR